MNTLTVRLSLFLFTLLCSAQGCLSGEVSGHYTSVSQNTHSLTHTKSHNASHGKSLAQKVFLSSAPGLFIHCCIIVNVIPNTLINTKLTRKHILVYMIGHLNTMHVRTHTHTHTHTKNESCSDEKAVFSEWTLWPILQVQEPILFYQALTDFLFNKTHLDTQHWPNVHYYNTANFLSETASFAMILDQMPQCKS